MNKKVPLALPRSAQRATWNPVARLWLTAAFICGAMNLTGCSFYRDSTDLHRLDQGLTIVLPGIEGESIFNGNIARGLESGEVSTAIRIHDWTTGVAPLALVHLRDRGRHRRQADTVARQIVTYQQIYPDRPVFLVGHSGGAALSLLVLEALPPEHRVAGVFMLAAAISPDFDIEHALTRTEHGIWNHYSPLDVPLLVAGTSLAGTIDGQWSASAGATGFDLETGENPLSPQLFQVPYRPEMLLASNPGGHMGPTFPSYVRRYVAPEIVRITNEQNEKRRLVQDKSPREFQFSETAR